MINDISYYTPILFYCLSAWATGYASALIIYGFRRVTDFF